MENNPLKAALRQKCGSRANSIRLSVGTNCNQTKFEVANPGNVLLTSH